MYSASAIRSIPSLLQRKSSKFSKDFHRALVLTAVVVLVASMVACGGSSSSSSTTGSNSNPVSVTVTPSTASLPAGVQTVQFAAAVQNTSNTAVNWQVNGVTGGDTTHGMITTGGLYTSPAVVPNPPTVTVTAISQADTTVSQTVTLTIAACSALCVSPSAASVAAGATATYAATLNGVTDTNVTWKVNGVIGGDAAHGTISAVGIYTAPATPPLGQTAMITAVDNGGGGTGTGAATIVFSNATLHGPYAFSFSGQTGKGFIAVAGSFTADGNGNIANGLQDINSGSGIFQSSTFTGTYSVGADGRGSATIQWATPAQTITWQIAMANDQHGLLVRFDGASSSNAGAGSGSIDRQDTSSFNSALNGNYVINVSGIDSAGNPLFQAGALTGAGGAVTSGVMDVNDNLVVQSSSTLSGTYSVASSGRGTLALTSATTLATQNFSVYVVNANLVNVVETDSGSVPAVLGNLNKAAANPGLSGNYAFTMGGADSSVLPLALGGVLTNGFTGGTIDENDNGVTGTLPSVTGCSCVFTGNRGQVTLTLSDNSTIGLAAYPAADGSVTLIGTDGTFAGAGVALHQASSLGQGALTGSFALNWNGTLFGSTSLEEEDISGQLTGNSSGVINGALDVSVFSVLTNPNAPASGSFSVPSSGRGLITAQVGGLFPTTFSHNAYVVDNNTTLVLDTDGTRVLLGVMKRQY